MRSTGTLDDDVIGHYIIARWSWKHPHLFFDIWGRPAFTILYAPAAAFGLPAVHIFSSFLACLTAVGSALLARSYKLRWYWLAVLFTGLQPEFVRQGFSGLTELTFAFILCITLLAYKGQRWMLMAVAGGFLPLARYENLPIVLVFMLLLIRRKRYAEALLLTTPMLLWNGYHAVTSGNWYRLIFPFDRLIGQQATSIVFDYGSGSPSHYLYLMPVAYGAVCFVLAAYGLIRMRFGILHLCTIITVFVLSVSYWLLPSTGIAGYIRHLSAISPVVGVAAVAGIERSFTQETRRSKLNEMVVVLLAGIWLTVRQMYASGITALQCIANATVVKQRRVIVFCELALVLLLFATSTLMQVSPFALIEEQATVIEAARWYTSSEYHNRLTLGSHIWFVHATGIDPLDRNRYRQLTLQEIEQAPVGSIIIWDSHYSNRLVWNTHLSVLQNDSRFQELRQYKVPKFELHIFLKTRQ